MLGLILPQDTRPSKKSRVVHEDEDEDELEPAGVWVK